MFHLLTFSLNLTLQKQPEYDVYFCMEVFLAQLEGCVFVSFHPMNFDLHIEEISN